MHLPTHLEPALAYARRGWRVYPIHGIYNGCCTCRRPNCDNPAKHPLETGGFKAASCEEQTLRQWFRGVANVGLATGAASGLLVLDIDPKHGGDASLAFLEAQHGSLPPTPTVTTGGGGRHFYFRYPNVGLIASDSNRWPGIDVRATR